MNKKQLLVNREFNLVEGRVNWYSSRYKLLEYPSVKVADFYDTTSSAGDWSGYFIQRIGNMNYFILFWQESNYPRYGYTVHTEGVKASWRGNYSRNNIDFILSEMSKELEELYE